MGSIIPFKPQVSEEPDFTGLIDEMAKVMAPRVHITTTGEAFGKEQIDIESLYPLSHELNPQLATAVRLINEGLTIINAAINMEREADLISSDDAIHRLQALLPELFCCRSIGDGFAAIVNAIYHSISNMHGTPLNAQQLQAIKKALSRINTGPFLVFEEAVDEISSLEEAGFDVEPSHFKYAADLLDE